MSQTVTHPITQKWPQRSPGAIQLYSLTTPNGIKISAALEETGLLYNAHYVDFDSNDQFSPEFLSLNPNNKIPAIIDPDGPEGRQVELFESGAILLYLAEKSGKLLSTDSVTRLETIQWLFFQIGGIGPMFGQLGFFHKFAGKDIADKRGRDRYVAEVRRLYGVLEHRLTGRQWIMGDDYTIADIAMWPWLGTIDGFYEAGDLVGTDDFPAVQDYIARASARPASVAAVNIPSKG